MSIQRPTLFEKTCEAQDLTCGICLEPYNNPMSISECLHTFCKTCIEPVRRCPICSVEFITQKHLKRDFYKAERIEAIRKECFAVAKQEQNTSIKTEPQELKAPVQLPESPCNFTIEYRTGKSTHITGKTTITVGQLGEYIERRDCVPKDLQRLIFNGRRIDATPADLSKTLSELGVQEGSVIHMVLAIRG